MGHLKIASLFILLFFIMMVSSCVRSPAVPTPGFVPTSAPTVTPHTFPGLPSSTTLNPTQTPTLIPSLAPSSSEEEIIDKVTQSMTSVASYHLDRNISATKTIESDGKSDVFDLSAWSSMALDLSGYRSQMDNQINVKPPAGQPAWPVLDNSIYIVGGTIYIRGLFPDEPQLWGKTSATDNYWQMQNQATYIIGLLQMPHAVVLPPESIHSGNLDIPCDVLQVTPDLDRFWALLLQQPGIQTLGLPSQPPESVTFSQMIKSVEMKLSVAQLSGVPVKAELSMSMQIGPALSATLTSDVSMDVRVSMLFSNYNQPVPIELPQDAKDAVELNLQKAQ